MKTLVTNLTSPGGTGFYSEWVPFAEAVDGMIIHYAKGATNTTSYAVSIEGRAGAGFPPYVIDSIAHADDATLFPSSALQHKTSKLDPPTEIRAVVTAIGGSAITSFATTLFDGGTAGNSYVPSTDTAYGWQDARLSFPAGIPPEEGWGLVVMLGTATSWTSTALLTSVTTTNQEVFAWHRNGYAVLQISTTGTNDSGVSSLDYGIYRIAGDNRLTNTTYPKGQKEAIWGVQFGRWLANRYPINKNRVVLCSRFAGGTPFALWPLRIEDQMDSNASDVFLRESSVPNALYLNAPIPDFSVFVNSMTGTCLPQAADDDALAATFGDVGPDVKYASNPFLSMFPPESRDLAYRNFKTPIFIHAPQDTAGPGGAASFNSSLAVTQIGPYIGSPLGLGADAAKLTNKTNAWGGLALKHFLNTQAASNFVGLIPNIRLNFGHATANPTDPTQSALVNSLINSRDTDAATIVNNGVSWLNEQLGYSDYTDGLNASISVRVQAIGR